MNTKALFLHSEARKAGYFDFDLSDFSDYVEITRENDIKIPTYIDDVINEMNELLRGDYTSREHASN